MTVENVHRSHLLDSYIGHNIGIEFKDCAEILTGVLLWIEDVGSGFMPGMYLLNGSRKKVSFYKSHIKKIRLPNGREIPGSCL